MKDLTLNKRTVGLPAATIIVAACFGVGLFAGEIFAASTADARSSIRVSAYSSADGMRGADGKDGEPGADGKPGSNGVSSVSVDIVQVVNGEVREVHESREVNGGTVVIDVVGTSSSVTVAPNASARGQEARNVRNAGAGNEPVIAASEADETVSPSFESISVAAVQKEAGHSGVTVKVYSIFNAVVAYVTSIFR